MWSSNWFFIVLIAIPAYDLSFKCCQTPAGYYIDYVSCYYVATHDVFFEYYDNAYNFIVYCAQGYVMTGISRKLNQYSNEYSFDWIQCCRVGLGTPVVAMPPPIIYSRSGSPAYFAATSSRIGASDTVPLMADDYQEQYRTGASDENVLLAKKEILRRKRGMDEEYAGEDMYDAAQRPELYHLLQETRGRRHRKPGTREYREIEEIYEREGDSEEVRQRLRRTRD